MLRFLQKATAIERVELIFTLIRRAESDLQVLEELRIAVEAATFSEGLVNRVGGATQLIRRVAQAMRQTTRDHCNAV